MEVLKIVKKSYEHHIGIESIAFFDGLVGTCTTYTPQRTVIFMVNTAIEDVKFGWHVSMLNVPL